MHVHHRPAPQVRKASYASDVILAQTSAGHRSRHGDRRGARWFGLRLFLLDDYSGWGIRRLRNLPFESTKQVPFGILVDLTVPDKSIWASCAELLPSEGLFGSIRWGSWKVRFR